MEEGAHDGGGAVHVELVKRRGGLLRLHGRLFRRGFLRLLRLRGRFFRRRLPTLLVLFADDVGNGNSGADQA